jgi:hypothetical protein
MRSNTHVLNQELESTSRDRDSKKIFCAQIFHPGLELKISRAQFVWLVEICCVERDRAAARRRHALNSLLASNRRSATLNWEGVVSRDEAGACRMDKPKERHGLP